MYVEGWQYYNHAAIPDCAPHETPDIKPIKDGSIWKIGEGITILARWTEDYDCNHETEWWYVVKDEPFDISTLKSKRRYEINKGNKYFDVKVINPADYKDELYEVAIAAFSSWPNKYRPAVDEKKFKSNIDAWNSRMIFGAFYKESGVLCGFAVLQECQRYINFVSLRVRPDMEKYAVNAAIVNGILMHYNDRLTNNFYICDGARSIRHETAFQDYLEKYFGFRKAYCKICIKYRSIIKYLVALLYPLKGIISDKVGIGSQVLGILRMEEINRSFKE